MTKTPRPEAISSISLAARKEVVVTDELKMLSVKAPFHCAYHHAFQIPVKPTSIIKLHSCNKRNSDKLTSIQRRFTNGDLQCGEFSVPNDYMPCVFTHARMKRRYVNSTFRFTAKPYYY